MLARVFALLPLAALAVAVNYQCNTGAVNCCSIVGTSRTPPIASLLKTYSAEGLLDGVNIPVNALLGANCTAGAGGPCRQQPICCDNKKVGDISINCTSVTG